MSLRTALAAGLVALSCCACRDGAPRATTGAGPRPLTLAAAASLAELAADLAAAWERDTGQPVRVRLGASSTLARQLGAGASADLFLSADAAWVDRLDVRARRPWLGNRLVLVRPAADRASGADGPVAPVAVATPDAARSALAALDGLALGAEGVPVGRYAVAALEGLGVAPPARVVRGAHARDVLAKVADGAAPAGLVYLTDAALDDGVEAALVLPASCHPPIRYEVALLDPAAAPLLDALDAPWALALAAAHGFGTPAPSTAGASPTERDGGAAR